MVNKSRSKSRSKSANKNIEKKPTIESELKYSERIKSLHGICLAEVQAGGAKSSVNLADSNELDAAYYLASYITFNAISAAGRDPKTELTENFDMLSVYQAYGLLTFSVLTAPLAAEKIKPDYKKAQVMIAKGLFSGIPSEQISEIANAGFDKVRLVSSAEHWSEFREKLNKRTLSFVIVGTDDESPHQKEGILPLFGELLSQLCEGFEKA